MESLTFEFKGTLIKNPNLDETGRFEVNPVDYYGAYLLDAVTEYKYKELEDLLKKSKIDVEDTSWHNDTCRSMSINLKDGVGYIQIYTPNSIRLNDASEEINTYYIQKDIYKVGIDDIGEYNNAKDVVKAIVKLLS